MSHQNDQREHLKSVLARLEEAREFSGPPSDFWPTCLQSLAAIAGAGAAVMVVHGPEPGTPWKRIAIWPSTSSAKAQVRSCESMIDRAAREAETTGLFLEAQSHAESAPTDGSFLLACRLEIASSAECCIAAFLLSRASEQEAEESLGRVCLVANTPAIYQSRRVAHIAEVDVDRIAAVLGLTNQLNAETRFMGAAMSFCNELAARYQCDRVGLGSLEKNTYVRVQALSHAEKFERKMEAVHRLEAAMEEALDQDQEILWPRPEDSAAVTRDHEAYAAVQGTRFLSTIPLRVDGRNAFAVTFERSTEPFGEQELRVIQISCDACARRLSDLKLRDRWFGARFAAWLREKLSSALGVEHTWVKLLVVVVCVALGVLLFGKGTYRVEAPFSVVTDEMAYVPAPFEGHVEKVLTRVGRRVGRGDTLLLFDTRALRLEEISTVADLSRYLREVEKARSARELAEMQINQALADQAQARLDTIRLRLEQGSITAPMPGYVVEGDLEEMVGAPVKQGDVLFKIVQIEKMYVEIKVDEAEFHELEDGMKGEIAFNSQPRLKFPIQVRRIVPVAESGPEGNTFTVQAGFTGEKGEWWRPGMAGIAKLDVARRNLLWIFTHRAMDRVRMWIWW